MTELLNTEILLRGGLFAGLLTVLLVSERLAPRRRPVGKNGLRWTSNLAIGGANILMLRFALPMLGFGLALTVESEGWGVFRLLDLEPAVAFVLSILLLDLLIWGQHRLLHWQPLLWRLHRMHHSDPDFDATTAVRFHPLEAAFSMGLKSIAIVLLGVTPPAFLTFEIILSSTSLFNHSNVNIPERLDRVLRWFVVTPDMHRVHHSSDPAELNRNFGFNLPWWDRLFGTYHAQPALGHRAMHIGTREFSERRDQRLDRLLLQPFYRPD